MTIEPDTALESFRNLTHIVLKPLQGADLPLIDDFLISDQLHDTGTHDLAFIDNAARDRSRLGDHKDLLHQGTSDKDLF